MQTNFNWSNNMSTKKDSNITDAAQDKKLNSRLQECPIAIVGMASVFAETKNLDQFWDNIVNSVNGIKDIPEDRWAVDDYYSSDKSAEDKTYCKRGGFLPGIDFDPMEFGLPPNILELTDISQLMSLVVARDVLADAGISDEKAYDRDKIGITLGVGGGQKQSSQLTARLQTPILDKVLKASGVNAPDREMILSKFKKAYIPWQENSFPGMLGNVIAGRIANRFDFGGMNCVVDAACAGSLAAIKMAVSELLEYRSDMMISGGVCCDNSPFMYLSFSKTPAFTEGDDIRPFDKDSSGMMIGEGVGMIALKRLEDAERDGDKIYSVIKGIGSSSDGRFKSIYAPRPSGQVKALQRAYNDAGADAMTCGLIEAHGTGTKAGDSAEFSALKMMFSQSDGGSQHIALGTIKSQIGHTKAAAGTAGIIKASLALHHKVLPATINVDLPNPNLEIEKSAFYINNETRPWMPRADGIKRLAGVSSFGFGGTNFHFVLEEYKAHHDRKYRLNHVPQSILISATDKNALLVSLSAYVQALNVESDLQAYAFNVLLTENPVKAVPKNEARCGFVAKDATQALAALNLIIIELKKADVLEFRKESGLYYRHCGLDVQGNVVALFSGQGSQYINMGRDLTCNFPSMLASSAKMDTSFTDAGVAQLSKTLFPIPVFSAQARQVQEETLRLTQNAQPAIGTFSMGLFNILKQAGLKIDFAAGHSFGELTALWAAGVIEDDDYMLLARSRGAAMATPDDEDFDAGTMLAVMGDAAKVAQSIESIKGVSIANYNSKQQVVIAGATADIALAFTQLQSEGYKVVKLPVSAAFHTDLVKHAQKPFAKVIDSVKFHAPNIPVFSNASAQAHPTKGAEIKRALKKHILESVHFKEEIENLYAAGGRIFIEFGPKNVLSRLVANILEDQNDVQCIALNSNPKKSSDIQLRLAAVELAVLGLELNDIDPYSAVSRPLIAPKKSPLMMKLTGASYVSPKTKKAFSDALNDDWTLSSMQPQIIEKEVIKEVIIEKIVEVEKIVYVERGELPAGQLAPCSADIGSAIERSVQQFVAHQTQLLNVHEAYMQGPKDYAKTFQNVLASQAGQSELPESLDKTLGLYHQFQLETLRVHESYLNNQTANMSQMLSRACETPRVMPSSASSAPLAAKLVEPHIASTVVMQEKMPVPVTPVAMPSVVAPAPVQAPIQTPIQAPIIENSINISTIEQVMLSVVADKTGYPVEMLEMHMDMEADLGIDSIKRVEILGAVQDEITNLPELDAMALAELRTLGEIVSYMQAQAPSAEMPASANTATIAPVVSASFDLKSIEQVMLSVVADKTGYPVEMLEMHMDMEADLGIDSIKRVEILGAVQDEITNLPELDAMALAELRTLGEIVSYMQAQAPSVEMPASTSTSTPAATPVATASVDLKSFDLKSIEQVMLSVVADKTGYPVEMLEMHMDMEADLGIDSIKRVEILGAVQDEITNLPELDAMALAELRTLGEIVSYMQAQAPSTENAEMPASTSTPAATPVVTASVDLKSFDLKSIEQVMLSVVADKTGYPVEMLEMHMDMEADLGIDSIKRVEILGAVQDEITNLPELDAMALAELRTLGEIVSYMQAQAPSASAENTEMSASTSTPAVTVSFDLKSIEKVMLSVVADKTGYPVEMLEMHMDMEADLGIDSIKRVEILGAVQDEITNLPELDAMALAELRTLGEIVSYMQAQAPSTENAEMSASTSTPAATASFDLKSIEKVMLSVVADKTGYPAEMLEMHMDMEADLGIDSIKRVEILGAVQDEITHLPELDAMALAELRTLGEIVNYMQEVAAPTDVLAIEKTLPLTTPVAIAPKKFDIDFVPAPSRIVSLKYIDDAFNEATSVDGQHLLLVDDGEPNTSLLADKLAQQGWSITLLQAAWVEADATRKFAENINIVTLSALSEPELQSILSVQKCWHSIVYLHPKMSVPSITYPERSKQGLQLAFLLAKLSGLGKNAESNDVRSSFLVLTRQGGRFMLKDVPVDADMVQGGLCALVKTLHLEWPHVFCRAIDVASDWTPEKVANCLFNEFNDKSVMPVEVGFDEKGRLTPSSELTDSYALTSGTHLNKDALFLVSGGAKGVTAQCAIRLAAQYQCKFILLGRSEYDANEPLWAQGINDPVALKKAGMQILIERGVKATPMALNKLIKPLLSSREISETLQAIQALGSLVEYVSADVTDSDAVENAVLPITQLWGDISGIIHGAGVLADKLIEQKTLKDFESVYSTKIQGLGSLLNCCDLAKIKHLVLFSSAAGFYGNPGQSDYAIANDILNKTAYRFKSLYPKAQVLSFNWGPWDGGMVTPALKEMFKKRGVYIIPVASGAQLLVNELACIENRSPQILVGNDMAGAPKSDNAVKKPQVSHLVKPISVANNPFLQDHKIAQNAVLPTVCAIAWMQEAVLSMHADYQYAGLQDYKLFKGIIFDGSQKEQYGIECKTLKAEQDELLVSVRISSKNEAGLSVAHYGATLHLTKNKKEQPVYSQDLPALTAQTHTLYDDGTLFHGPSLQGIKGVLACDEKGLLLSCLVASSVRQVQGDFDVEKSNIFANDLVYQALLVWVRKELGLGSLPTATQHWQVYAPAPLDTPFYLLLSVQENKRNKKISADVLLMDAQKQVFASLKGVQVTANKSLNDLFKKVAP
ncbi:polyunsaturated fatty acid synthase PfaA [Psychromonas sp. CNPT3]|uniref:type I polyketide synthase n=1 Tax=Psychromonas sp. CNPT3 TaxID=314282 RepID=UPI00006E2D2A|nr:type I polyketide synthase [Psychromonas sp. CNPT3]AGH81296.1 polyunsaturated fatty acid synthase PfaA [Psychromonas sp. CNPT3]